MSGFCRDWNVINSSEASSCDIIGASIEQPTTQMSGRDTVFSSTSEEEEHSPILTVKHHKKEKRYNISSNDEQEGTESDSSLGDALPPDVSGILWKSKVMAASTPKRDKPRTDRDGGGTTLEGEPSCSKMAGVSTILTASAREDDTRPPPMSPLSEAKEVSCSSVISASVEQGGARMAQRHPHITGRAIVLSDSEEEVGSSGLISASVEQGGAGLKTRTHMAHEPIALLDSDEEESKKETIKGSSSDSDVEIIDDSSYIQGPPGAKRKRKSKLRGDILALEWKRDQAMRRLSVLETAAKYVKIDDLPDRGETLNVTLNESRVEVEMISKELSNVGQMLVSVESGNDDDDVENSSPKLAVWDALPKAGVALSDMGKRALETHHLQSVATVEALKSLQHSLESKPGEEEEASDPVGLKVPLMQHQRRALNWMLWRERQRPAGGILADDMGLGKTLTMISLILKFAEMKKANQGNDSDSSSESSQKSYKNGKTLVVCPSSVMSQWDSEIKSKVTKGLLYSVIHHGPKRDAKPSRLACYDVVLTSYAIIQKDDKEDNRGPLLSLKWDRVILDEAHMIRNHKSLTSQAVQKLKARHRWCLTGTPIQNKMTDFYSLLKFLRCKPFNDWLVWKRWVDNKDMAGAQRLNCISDSILLRRTKDSIKDSNLKLKSKTVKLIKVQLDDDEKKVYEELAHFSSTILAQMLAEKAEKENLLSSGIPTFNAKKLYELRDENPFKDHPELARLHRNMIAMGNVKTHNILELIMRLRQICCHASLARGIVEKVTGSEKSSEDKSDEIWERLMTLSVDNNDDEGSSSSGILTKDNPVFRKDRLSSKVREVVRLLKEDILPRGDKMEKVVVVSQWTSLLDIIKTFLKKEDIWSVLLTGQVPVKDRQAIIEAFNNDILGARVLLLSLTAGGTGLNLIGGNHLLMVDVHWNPQLEAQACDRVYRVGQEKEVFIYKFICTDTIEESIKRLQETKLKLASSVLKEQTDTSSQLSINDLKMLFNMH